MPTQNNGALLLKQLFGVPSWRIPVTSHARIWDDPLIRSTETEAHALQLLILLLLDGSGLSSELHRLGQGFSSSPHTKIFVFYFFILFFDDICLFFIFLREAPLPFVRVWNRSRLFVCLSVCPRPEAIIRPHSNRLAVLIMGFWGSPLWINTVGVRSDAVVNLSEPRLCPAIRAPALHCCLLE